MHICCVIKLYNYKPHIHTHTHTHSNFTLCVALMIILLNCNENNVKIQEKNCLKYINLIETQPKHVGS